MSVRRRQAFGMLAVLAAVAAALAVRLLVVRVAGGGLTFGWPGGTIGDIRLHSAAAGLAAGAALGGAGALLQALLRNPLASPFVLGVTGGAGCGVALAALGAALAGAAAPQGAALTLPATAGAAVALGAVLALARRAGSTDPTMLILGGVIVGAIAAALSTVAESLLPPDRRGLLVGWLHGRIPDAPDRGALAACALGAAAVASAGLRYGRWIDAATLSDDEARSVGVPLGGLRTGAFALCGFATAATVVLCGPIAFVGLLAPHCARALVGPTARWLVPASCACGGSLLVGADALRQVVDVGGGRIPLGAITAVTGGIAFLFLLRRTAAGWSR